MVRFLVENSLEQYELALGRWYFIFYGQEGFTVFWGRSCEFTHYDTLDGFILACALLSSVILALWHFRRAEHSVRLRDIGIGAALIGVLALLIVAAYGLWESLWVLGMVAVHSIPVAGVLVALHLRRSRATTVRQALIAVAAVGGLGAASTLNYHWFSMANATLVAAGALLSLAVFGITALWFWVGRHLCARLARAPSADGDSEAEEPRPTQGN